MLLCQNLRATQANLADLATERERQVTTARANQTTTLTNRRAANWAPEVAFSPFRTLSRRQLTFPFFCKISLILISTQLRNWGRKRNKHYSTRGLKLN